MLFILSTAVPLIIIIIVNVFVILLGGAGDCMKNALPLSALASEKYEKNSKILKQNK